MRKRAHVGDEQPGQEHGGADGGRAGGEDPRCAPPLSTTYQPARTTISSPSSDTTSPDQLAKPAHHDKAPRRRAARSMPPVRRAVRSALDVRRGSWIAAPFTCSAPVVIPRRMPGLPRLLLERPIAASTVGKKCFGSMVLVNSYCSILRRTGSFIAAKTRLTPLASSSRSRSWSMSAAVVSTSVMGSAATTIHKGCGSTRERADLFAERSRVGEEHGRVEPEDRAPRQALGFGIAAHVVVPRTPGTLPSRVWYGHQALRKTLPIESATASAIPGRTPSSTTPRTRRWTARTRSAAPRRGAGCP